jgi:hypothetical protein
MVSQAKRWEEMLEGILGGPAGRTAERAVAEVRRAPRAPKAP